ncbi:MAG: hypothetical protein CSA62_08890 [Planctomycetota bacterium]|nr:MAG: hypothetical protein CSA62_08890 [Planctomycetota bacterium]
MSTENRPASHSKSFTPCLLAAFETKRAELAPNLPCGSAQGHTSPKGLTCWRDLIRFPPNEARLLAPASAEGV